jgi:hypothetical protein
MQHPEVFYAAALGLFAVTEVGFRAFAVEAFGPMTWVLTGVFAASYAVYFSGLPLPAWQMWIHAVALIVGFIVARGAVGHFCASMFLPMALLGALHGWGKISDMTWWWGLFYLACVQLVFLGMGSNLHPVGRFLRRWSDQVHQHFNRLVGER